MKNATKRLSSLTRAVTLNGQEYLVMAGACPFVPTRRIFRAWRRDRIFGGLCGTLTSLNSERAAEAPAGWEGHLGLVGTERDSARYEHLKGGSLERRAAVDAQRADRAAEAHAAILAAFPEIAHDHEKGGALLGDYEIASSVEIA